jgi:hypothetical protein
MRAFGDLLRALFRSRLVQILGWIALVLAVAVAINVIGIRILGDLNSWIRWLDTHRRYFVIWRVCLYAATTYGWWWMHKRIRHREPGAETTARLRRIEVGAVTVILLFEATALLRS